MYGKLIHAHFSLYPELIPAVAPWRPASFPPAFQPAGLERPVNRVRETQYLMWPMARPTVPGLDYYSGWRMGRSRDVDYLDYFETDGGDFALAVGDVVAGSGEGSAPGALLLSSLHAMVRSLAAGPSQGHSRTQPSNILGELVQAIHEMFYEVSPQGSYATLFLARYDPVERRLDYCNAGHEAPVLLRKSNERWRAIPLEGGGPVVGVLCRSAYRQLSIRLQPGDILADFSILGYGGTSYTFSLARALADYMLWFGVAFSVIAVLIPMFRQILARERPAISN